MTRAAHVSNSARGPRSRADVLLRLAVGAGMALGAAATLGSFLNAAIPQASAQGVEESPLAGSWQTFANGDRINEILKEGDTLWAATDGGGLVRWDLTSSTYEQYLAPKSGLRSNKVYDIALDGEGKLWVATHRGLARFDPDSESFDSYTKTEYPDMPARRVTAVEPDGSGGLWLGFGQEYDATLANPRSGGTGNFAQGGFAHFNPVSGTVDYVTHAKLVGTPGTDPQYQTLPSDNIEVLLAVDNGVWVGTAPYYEWDASYCPVGQDCGTQGGAYVLVGGGLALYRPNDGGWSRWNPGSESSCYSNHIVDLASDSKGRVWVATLGRGLQMMRPDGSGGGCNGGQVIFSRLRGSYGDSKGVKGNHIFSVDIDEDDRVWVSMAERGDTGLGIAVLDHNETFGDPRQPWSLDIQDDDWRYFDVDNAPGSTNLIVNDIWAQESGQRYFGTIDVKAEDGHGIRSLNEGDHAWSRFLTGDTGLPSNRISFVAANPENGDLWVGTNGRGVSRFDGDTWTNWRAFQAGAQVTSITSNVAAGYGRLPVDFADRTDCEAAFPGNPRYARIGSDPRLYEVRRCLNSANGRYMDIQPDLEQSVTAGTPVFVVERGPASDVVTQIDFDSKGRVWVGGSETIFMTGPNGQRCATFPECWLDGGLSYYDGEQWHVYNEVNTPGFPDQEVQSVEVDLQDRIWMGTGNPRDPYADGMAVLTKGEDGAEDQWVFYKDRLDRSYLAWMLGTADIDVDPVTGHVWVAMHAATECANSGPFGGDCTSEIRRGGGVGRFNGATWRFWAKTGGANLKLYGDQYQKMEGGEAFAVKIDRSRLRVWVGGWDGEPKSFHWDRGEGFDAALNWCAIPSEAPATETPGTPNTPTLTPTPIKGQPTLTPTVDPNAVDCAQHGWQSKIWAEDGQVEAIEIDSESRVWVGVHRNGNGIVPPVAGVKLLGIDEAWHTIVPDNSGLPSNEITTLSAIGKAVWVGTRVDGIAHYIEEIPPTPTPSSTRTSTAGPTHTATQTREHTSTPQTGTPGTPATATRTRTPGGTPDTATPTRTGQVDCVGGRCWYLWAPIVMQSRSLVTPVPRTPTATTSGPVSPSPTRQATTTIPSPTVTGGSSPVATTVTPALSATPSNTPDQAANTSTATNRPPSATPSNTPKPSPVPLKEWREYDGSLGALPDRADFMGVTGTDKNHVWFIGENGNINFFDGTQMWSQQAPPIAQGKLLRKVLFLDDLRGYIAGDGGALLSTTNGGANWRTVNPDSQADDWGAVAMFKEGGLVTGWAFGRDKGTRVRFDGSTWTSSSVDRNTRHSYSDAVMLSPTRAYAIRDDGSGARMYDWEGTGWGAGASTGAMHDMAMYGEEWGLAVGDRGSVWEFIDGAWFRMSRTPATTGRDLHGVHIVSPEQAWAVGERTTMYLWNGAEWSQPDLLQGRNRNFNSIWIDPTGTDGWAVGDDGLVFRYR